MPKYCIFILAVLVLSISALFSIYFFNQTLSGIISVSSLYGESTIKYESSSGIPYIAGNTNESVFFALGYAHAADRLYDMAFKRALARGRLSEVFNSLLKYLIRL